MSKRRLAQAVARQLAYAVENQETAARLHAVSTYGTPEDRRLTQDVSAAYYRAARQHLATAMGLDWTQV